MTKERAGHFFDKYPVLILSYTAVLFLALRVILCGAV